MSAVTTTANVATAGPSRRSRPFALLRHSAVLAKRGLIAPGVSASDRTTTLCTPVRSATVIWEEVLHAVAIDEPSWRWRPAGTDIGGYSSTELAERCVDRLRSAAAGAVIGA